MIQIKTNILPPKGFAAITLWPFILIRRDWEEKADESKYLTVLRHEAIHAEQQKEMLIVFFYLWYLIEWLIRLAYYKSASEAYRNISFEREAYENQYKVIYNRRWFEWLKYV